ncbi:MAG: undecaprenyl-diphosphate phosphatase [Opitutales bacterium]|nr:undecaprenyl-diphosphate phosphatase [Opitutales bacterium]
MPDIPTRLFPRRGFLTILLMLGACIPLLHGTEPDLLPPNPQAHSTSPASGLGYMDAAVLGVVEGLTEYLPVSSTGHLILADQILLSSDHPNLDPGFQTARNAYLIAIQGGAILAVVILYWKRIQSILKGCLGLDPTGMRLGIRILLAFIPSAALGLMIQDWMEVHLFHPEAVALSLIVGAFLMIWVEWKNRAKNALSAIDNPNGIENLSKRQAIVIGCFQCLALWPGMSRSMSTIVGAYWVGLKPAAAAEFSFLLGLLTLSAASIWSLIRAKEAVFIHLTPGPAIAGTIIAMAVAMLAVRWFVSFLCRHGLAWFALYRILVGLAVLGYAYL